MSPASSRFTYSRSQDPELQHFTGRLDQAQEFALATRVLLLANASGVPIDVSLGALPFEGRVLDRASSYSVSETAAFVTCSEDDLPPQG